MYHISRGNQGAETALVVNMSTPPAFDPELAAVLAATGLTSVATGITPDTVQAQRETIAEDIMSVEQLRADDRLVVDEIDVPGPEGTVSLLVLRPRGVTAARPVVYHTHGGGLIVGNNRYGLEPILDWVVELQLVLVSVEYRLAPEHPYPAAVEDSYAGLAWTAAHATEIGGDANRIILAGASAGGNLAAGLALLARDRGEIPIAGQLLIYPMLDDRNDTVSSHQMLGLGVWDRISNETAWGAYLAGVAEVPPYAAPARATDLSGLPPTYLDVGSAETFRDEDVDYARRLWEAGVDAEFHVWSGAYHGFDLFAPDADVSQRATAARKHWLQRVLGSQPPKSR